MILGSKGEGEGLSSDLDFGGSDAQVNAQTEETALLNISEAGFN